MKNTHEPKSESSIQPTKTVMAALELLELFSMERQKIGLSEFVKLSGVPKANVLRHLHALEAAGFVKQDEYSKKYQLGFKVMELAYLAKKQFELRDIVMPYMRKLKELTGETTCLQILEGDWGICIERIDPNNILTYLPPIGSREYLHGGASRKVLLAHLSEEYIDEIIAQGLPKLTSNTVTDPKRLKEDLQEIREKGYSISCSEHVEGVLAIAAPIKDAEGNVIASLSVVGPKFRIDEEKQKECINYLLEIVKEISKEPGLKV